MSRGVITPDYYRHPKIREAAKRSPLAVALDVACICYCADQLTDGIIDQSAIFKVLPGSRRSLFRAILILEKVKRLRIHDDASWRVHGYLEHNPTAEQVLARRWSASERKRRLRAKQREVSQRDSIIVSPFDNDDL